ncbi:hypothetical protein STEG23_000481 [Scotinomys teguina]
MANSPTMCQLYVDKAIALLRKRFPTLRCVHYMDDILLAAKDKHILEQAYVDLTVLLRKKELVIAPEKDQRDPVWVPERLVRKIQYREDHGNWTGEFDNLMDQLRVAIVTVNSTQLDYWSSALCFDVNLCIFFHRLVEECSMMAGSDWGYSQVEIRTRSQLIILTNM